MKKTQTILIRASFTASAVLLFAGGLLVVMIGLAPKLGNVDAFFKWTCVFVKHAFPLGLAFAIPSVVLAVILRSRIISSVVDFMTGVDGPGYSGLFAKEIGFMSDVNTKNGGSKGTDGSASGESRDVATLQNSLQFEREKNEVLLNEVVALEDELVNRQLKDFEGVVSEVSDETYNCEPHALDYPVDNLEQLEAQGLEEEIRFLLDSTVLVFARKEAPTRRDPSFTGRRSIFHPVSGMTSTGCAGTAAGPGALDSTGCNGRTGCRYGGRRCGSGRSPWCGMGLRGGAEGVEKPRNRENL